MLLLDWAEPGDPPSYHYCSVQAKPLAKPGSYGSLTRELELELIRRYHEDGNVEALEWLVEAHRPMVVRMAKHRWRGNGTSLAALVEYGMLGLRIAAAPPRPSRTKKGKLVGFDPTRGYRFSTYARSYADKEMRAALADDPGPVVNPEFEQKATAAIETWGEASEEEWGKEEDDPPLDLRGRLLLIRELRFRSAYHKPLRPWTLWKPQGSERKPRPKNFRKHPTTKTELQSKDAFYSHCFALLQTFEDTAATGIDGWDDREDEDREMWFPCSGAFDHKLYKLPRKVLQQRWRLGCKQQGKIIPFASNQGLGLFDKFGSQLPIYPAGADDRCVRLKLTYTPFLCLKPLASIYLVRGEVIFRRRFAFYRDLPRMEGKRWVRLTKFPPARLPDGSKNELANVANITGIF
jgi:hypothetical protein